MTIERSPCPICHRPGFSAKESEYHLLRECSTLDILRAIFEHIAALQRLKGE